MNMSIMRSVLHAILAHAIAMMRNIAITRILRWGYCSIASHFAEGNLTHYATASLAFFCAVILLSLGQSWLAGNRKDFQQCVLTFC
jgi:hypothetical protein